MHTRSGGGGGRGRRARAGGDGRASTSASSRGTGSSRGQLLDCADLQRRMVRGERTPSERVLHTRDPKRECPLCARTQRALYAVLHAIALIHKGRRSTRITPSSCDACHRPEPQGKTPHARGCVAGHRPEPRWNSS